MKGAPATSAHSALSGFEMVTPRTLTKAGPLTVPSVAAVTTFDEPARFFARDGLFMGSITSLGEGSAADAVGISATTSRAGLS